MPYIFVKQSHRNTAGYFFDFYKKKLKNTGDKKINYEDIKKMLLLQPAWLSNFLQYLKNLI